MQHLHSFIWQFWDAVKIFMTNFPVSTFPGIQGNYSQIVCQLGWFYLTITMNAINMHLVYLCNNFSFFPIFGIHMIKKHLSSDFLKKVTWSEINCLSVLLCNICYQTVAQSVMRVFCLEISHCNFQRKQPLEGWNVFLCSFRKSCPGDDLHQKQLLIEMFRVLWFFILGTCVTRTEVNAPAKLVDDTMCSFWRRLDFLILCTLGPSRWRGF